MVIGVRPVHFAGRVKCAADGERVHHAKDAGEAADSHVLMASRHGLIGPFVDAVSPWNLGDCKFQHSCGAAAAGRVGRPGRFGWPAWPAWSAWPAAIAQGQLRSRSNSTAPLLIHTSKGTNRTPFVAEFLYMRVFLLSSAVPQG